MVQHLYGLGDFDLDAVYDLGNQWIAMGDSLHDQLNSMTDAIHGASWTGPASVEAGAVWDEDISRVVKNAAHTAYQIGGTINYWGDKVKEASEKAHKEAEASMIAEIVASIFGIFTMGLGTILARVISIIQKIVDAVIEAISGLLARLGSLASVGGFALGAVSGSAVQLGIDMMANAIGDAAAGLPFHVDWKNEAINLGIAGGLGGIAGGVLAHPEPTPHVNPKGTGGAGVPAPKVPEPDVSAGGDFSPGGSHTPGGGPVAAPPPAISAKGMDHPGGTVLGKGDAQAPGPGGITGGERANQVNGQFGRNDHGGTGDTPAYEGGTNVLGGGDPRTVGPGGITGGDRAKQVNEQIGRNNTDPQHADPGYTGGSNVLGAGDPRTPGPGGISGGDREKQVNDQFGRNGDPEHADPGYVGGTQVLGGGHPDTRGPGGISGGDRAKQVEDQLGRNGQGGPAGYEGGSRVLGGGDPNTKGPGGISGEDRAKQVADQMNRGDPPGSAPGMVGGGHAAPPPAQRGKGYGGNPMTIEDTGAGGAKTSEPGADNGNGSYTRLDPPATGEHGPADSAAPGAHSSGGEHAGGTPTPGHADPGYVGGTHVLGGGDPETRGPGGITGGDRAKQVADQMNRKAPPGAQAPAPRGGKGFGGDPMTIGDTHGGTGRTGPGAGGGTRSNNGNGSYTQVEPPKAGAGDGGSSKGSGSEDGSTSSSSSTHEPSDGSSSTSGATSTGHGSDPRSDAGHGAGVTPHEQAPPTPHGQAPHGQAPHGQAPHEQAPHGQTPETAHQPQTPPHGGEHAGVPPEVTEHVANLPDVTVYVDNALNFGHQAAATNLIDAIRGLGYRGGINLVAPPEVRERLGLLIPPHERPNLTWHDPGFRPAGGGDSTVFVAGTERLDGSPETAGAFLDQAGANHAIVLKPYGWGNSTRYIYSRTGPGAPPEVRNLEEETTQGGAPPIGDDAVFRFPVPRLPHHDLNTMIDQRLPPAQANGLRPIIDAVETGNADLMPVYGLHRLDPQVQPTAMDTLAGGVHEAGGGRPSILFEFGDTRSDFVPPYERDWLTHAGLTDPDLAHTIAGLGPDDVLVVHGGNLPQDVFQQIYQRGSLPGVLEGANTSNLAQLTGRPFFSPRTEDTAYPRAGAPGTDRLGDVTEAIRHPTPWGEEIVNSETYQNLAGARPAHAVLNELPPSATNPDRLMMTQDDLGAIRNVLSHQVDGETWDHSAIHGVLGDHPELNDLLRPGERDYTNVRYDDEGYEIQPSIDVTPEQVRALHDLIDGRRRDLAAGIRNDPGELSNEPDPRNVRTVADAITDLRDPDSTLSRYFHDVHTRAHDPANDQVVQAIRHFLDRPATVPRHDAEAGPSGSTRTPTPEPESRPESPVTAHSAAGPAQDADATSVRSAASSGEWDVGSLLSFGGSDRPGSVASSGEWDVGSLLGFGGSDRPGSVASSGEWDLGSMAGFGGGSERPADTVSVGGQEHPVLATSGAGGNCFFNAVIQGAEHQGLPGGGIPRDVTGLRNLVGDEAERIGPGIAPYIDGDPATAFADAVTRGAGDAALTTALTHAGIAVPPGTDRAGLMDLIHTGLGDEHADVLWSTVLHETGHGGVLDAVPTPGAARENPGPLVAHVARTEELWQNPLYDLIPPVAARALNLDITVITRAPGQDPAVAHLNQDPAAQGTLLVEYNGRDHYQTIGAPLPASSATPQPNPPDPRLDAGSPTPDSPPSTPNPATPPPDAGPTTPPPASAPPAPSAATPTPSSALPGPSPAASDPGPIAPESAPPAPEAPPAPSAQAAQAAPSARPRIVAGPGPEADAAARFLPGSSGDALVVHGHALDNGRVVVDGRTMTPHGLAGHLADQPGDRPVVLLIPGADHVAGEVAARLGRPVIAPWGDFVRPPAGHLIAGTARHTASGDLSVISTPADTWNRHDPDGGTTALGRILHPSLGTQGLHLPPPPGTTTHTVAWGTGHGGPVSDATSAVRLDITGPRPADEWTTSRPGVLPPDPTRPAPDPGPPSGTTIEAPRRPVYPITEIDERRPVALDLDAPPPAPRPGVLWQDGAYLPSYFFDDAGLGHAQVEFRGPAEILAGLQRYTRRQNLPPATWKEITAALDTEPKSFLGDGRAFTVRPPGGRPYEIVIQARPRGDSDRFYDVNGRQVRVDRQDIQTADIVAGKTVGNSRHLSISAPFGPGPAPGTGVGRLTVESTGNERSFTYGPGTRVSGQREMRILDGSHVHVDDLDFAVHTFRTRLGHRFASGAPLTFTVRGGLRVRVPDPLTLPALSGAAPLPPTIAFNGRVPSVFHVERLGPLGPVADAALRQFPAAEVGTPAYEVIRNATGPDAVAGDLSTMLDGWGMLVEVPGTGSAAAGGLRSHVRLLSGELVTAAGGHEMRVGQSGGSRAETTATTSSGLRVGALGGGMGTAYAPGVRVRGQAGVTGKHEWSWQESAASGGASTRKKLVVSTGDTGLYKISVEYVLQRTGGEEVTVPGHVLLRLPRAEAERLASGTGPTPSREAPQAPPYLTEDRPATLGVHTVRSITGLGALQEQAIAGLAERYPGLVAPWRELDPAHPRWAGDAVRHAAALRNTTQLSRFLSADTLAANLDTVIGPGMRLPLSLYDPVRKTNVALRLTADLSNRRYAGTEPDLNTRSYSTVTDRLDATRQIIRSWSAGLSGNARVQASLGSLGPMVSGWWRYTWRHDTTSAFGQATSRDDQVVMRGGTDAFAYDADFRLEAADYTRPRNAARVATLDLLATQRFVDARPWAPVATGHGTLTVRVPSALTSALRGPVPSPVRPDAGTGRGADPRDWRQRPHAVVGVTGTARLNDAIQEQIGAAQEGSWLYTQPGTPAHEFVRNAMSANAHHADFTRMAGGGWHLGPLPARRPVQDRVGSVEVRANVGNLRPVSGLISGMDLELDRQAEMRSGHGGATMRGHGAGAMFSLLGGPEFDRTTVYGGYGGTWNIYENMRGHSTAAGLTGLHDVDLVPSGRFVLVTGDVTYSVQAQGRRTGVLAPRWAVETHSAPPTEFTEHDGVYLMVPEDDAVDLGLIPAPPGARPDYGAVTVPEDFLATPIGWGPHNVPDARPAFERMRQWLDAHHPGFVPPTDLEDVHHNRRHLLSATSSNGMPGLLGQMIADGVPVRLLKGTSYLPWTGSARLWIKVRISDPVFLGAQHNYEIDEYHYGQRSEQATESGSRSHGGGLSVTQYPYMEDSALHHAEASFADSGDSTRTDSRTFAHRTTNYDAEEAYARPSARMSFSTEVTLEFERGGRILHTESAPGGPLVAQVPWSLTVPGEHAGGALGAPLRELGPVADVPRTLPANATILNLGDVPGVRRAGTAAVAGLAGAPVERAYRTPLTQGGNAAGEVLANGLSQPVLRAFFPQATGRGGLTLPELPENFVTGGARARLTAHADIDYAGGTLVSVSDDHRWDVAQKNSAAATVASSRADRRTASAGGGPVAAVGEGSTVPGTGPAGGGRPLGDNETSGPQTQLTQDQRALMKNTNERTFVFRFPVTWRFTATGPSAGSRTTEHTVQNGVWIRIPEAEARDLGLITDAIFPAAVATEWDRLAAARDAWTVADGEFRAAQDRVQSARSALAAARQRLNEAMAALAGSPPNDAERLSAATDAQTAVTEAETAEAAAVRVLDAARTTAERSASTFRALHASAITQTTWHRTPARDRTGNPPAAYTPPQPEEPGQHEDPPGSAPGQAPAGSGPRQDPANSGPGQAPAGSGPRQDQAEPEPDRVSAETDPGRTASESAPRRAPAEFESPEGAAGDGPFAADVPGGTPPGEEGPGGTPSLEAPPRRRVARPSALPVIPEEADGSAAFLDAPRTAPAPPASPSRTAAPPFEAPDRNDVASPETPAWSGAALPPAFFDDPRDT